MGRITFSSAIVFLCLGFSGATQAYTPTLTSNGTPVRWSGSPKLNIAGNPLNSSGIDPGSFYNSVVRSLQRWQRASGGAVGFDYWQGTDAGVYEPDSDYNGLSSVYFASNAKSDPHLSPNVLGLTQVWFNTDTGEILETDIVLNDRDFHFTTNPSDTSGYGSAQSQNYSGGRSNVYVENVLTHEFGHAYGLSHSGGLQSTMLFMESPEQAHLGCDESVGIHALYPNGDAGARGTISGTVVTDAGAGVFGAHVVAISRRRGAVLATALSDRSGHYQITALEPGAYFLMVEPFFAGSSALPAYFSGVNAGICPGGADFGRSILMDGTGFRPQPIGVGASANTGAPTLVAHCGNGGGASMSANSISASSSNAPVIYDGSRDFSGFGAADRFSYSSTNYYKLRAIYGHVEVHAMSYSLYSPVHATLNLVNAAGIPVSSARVQDTVYQGDSGYVNYDTALTVDGLEAGDYTLQVSASAIDGTRYPGGRTSLDTVPFLVLTGSVNEGAPVLAGQLPVNARCRMDENFSAYSSPGGGPPRHSTDNGGGGTGFCGTISKGGASGGSSDGSGGGSGPTPGAMAGWLLPWAAMALMARLAQAMVRAQKRSVDVAQGAESG